MVRCLGEALRHLGFLTRPLRRSEALNVAEAIRAAADINGNEQVGKAELQRWVRLYASAQQFGELLDTVRTPHAIPPSPSLTLSTHTHLSSTHTCSFHGSQRPRWHQQRRLAPLARLQGPVVLLATGRQPSATRVVDAAREGAGALALPPRAWWLEGAPPRLLSSL